MSETEQSKPEPQPQWFVTKPVRKQAVQFSTIETLPPEWSSHVCIHLCGDNLSIPHRPHIHTLEGMMEISAGDWIIKGIKGEFYPCKPDIFATSYELEHYAASQPSVPATETTRLKFQIDRDSETEWSADTLMLCADGHYEVLGWFPCESQEEAEKYCAEMKALYDAARGVPSSQGTPKVCANCALDATDNVTICRDCWELAEFTEGTGPLGESNDSSQ
ncbi:MAG: hypothetical protein JWQ87_5429 [Candidatus Sulfotelmatobacter sp.]|nr:hypothetical protein [Candidatus Sulfotelmatobacter sp.]